MAINETSIKPSLQQTQQAVVKQDAPSAVPVDTVSVTPVDEGNSVLVNSVEKETSNQESLEELQDKVTQLNEHMQTLNRNLQFRVDEQSGDTVVKVVDAETEELVRQIPSQELLDIRNAIEKYKGIILEAKV